MKGIKMVDIEGQHAHIRGELDAAFQKVMDKAAFIQGDEVGKFGHMLSEYLGVRHVIPCGNGTDALQIAIMALDIPKGKEIITPAFNYVAAAETIALLGYKPVFAEIGEHSFNLDVSMVEKYVTSNTAAIIPVHLFGQPVNLQELLPIAKAHHLFIIEDNAQSLGADIGVGVKAGTVGHLGTTSFFPSKNLGGMGDGGALFTNDDLLATSARMIANHGQKLRYTFEKIGVNSRLDTLQAAMLSVKLPHLASYNLARKQAAAQYTALLHEVSQVSVPTVIGSHVYNQYTLKVKYGKRDALKTFLSENGVPSMVYYHKPLHLQPGYAYLGYKTGDFPVSEQVCNEVLSLPMHTELTIDQIEYICSKILEFFKTH